MRTLKVFQARTGTAIVVMWVVGGKEGWLHIDAATDKSLMKELTTDSITRLISLSQSTLLSSLYCNLSLEL